MMKVVFAPSQWDRNAKTIRFVTNTGRNVTSLEQGASKQVGQNGNKKKVLLKVTTDLNAAPARTKVTIGRVAKRKAGPKRGGKMRITPALAKAAAEELMDGNASLKKKYEDHLLGGRFRYLNEQLYTSNSNEAQKLFDEDPAAFDAYHKGYRHQVAQWPLNPLDRIVKKLSKLPKNLHIGDFGCGEGALAKALPHKVYSMDLVSSRDDIIACDMANTPLEFESLDVAVYCLSLMGTCLHQYLLEANRVLRVGGLLYIAEIKSRFDDVRAFVNGINSCGFELLHKDISNELFYFFQFKKLRCVGRVAILKPVTLKPCLYRKR